MVWKHVWPRFSCFAKQNAIFLSLNYIHTGDAPRNHRPFNSGNMIVSRGFWWHVQVMLSICGSSSPFYFDVDPFWNARKSPIFLSHESSRRKHAAWGVQQLEVQQAHPPWNGRTMDQASWTFPSSTWTLGSQHSKHFLASNVPRIFTQMGVVETKLFIELPIVLFSGFDTSGFPGQTPLKSIEPLEWEQDSGRTFVTYGSSFANAWPRSHSDWNTWDPWGSRERAASIKDYAKCPCHMH